MGREVRMVPANWEHPKHYNHHRGEEVYKPLLASPYSESFRSWREDDMPEWLAHYDQWQNGMVWDWGTNSFKPIDWDKFRSEDRTTHIKTYEDYAGVCPSSPDPNDHMPDWPDEERTHFMMYEDTSEGTPISPAFATPEELARWLADNEASAFAGETATYDQWLKTIIRGSAVSAVFSDGVMQSGVAFEGNT